MSGNVIYNGQTGVDHMHYDDATQTFFLIQSDEIITVQGSNVNGIFSSQGTGYQPLDFTFNNTTGKIIFCVGPTIASMDFDGSNLNYQQAFTYQVETIGAK